MLYKDLKAVEALDIENEDAISLTLSSLEVTRSSRHAIVYPIIAS
jgi:hypothetical protein